MIYNGAIELIGKTPVLKLKNMVDKNSADVYVKLKSLILVEVLRIEQP